VGGAVRDQLLGLPVKERDWVVVGATPETMVQRGFKPVGKTFPVFLHPETGEEYALARTEQKVSPGYTGFTFNTSTSVTLEDDLKRRDLTINAMAQNEKGEIIDPFGGEKDLRQGILRHVSPAFVEDPVRLLRIARFAARFVDLNFSVAVETNNLMKKMVSMGEVDALVPERIWQELAKALMTKAPSIFFTTLRNCDALSIIFPSLNNLFGVPNPEEYHPEIDSGIHTLMVVDQAARLQGNLAIRFAALLHDLGKTLTPKDQWPHHYGHEKKGTTLVKEFCQQYRAPKNCRDLALLVTRYHGKIHKVLEMTTNHIIKLLEDVDAYRRPKRFEQLLLACRSDHNGRLGYEDKPYTQGDFLWQAYKITQQIDTKSLAEKKLTGPAIANEIHHLRVSKLKKEMK